MDRRAFVAALAVVVWGCGRTVPATEEDRTRAHAACAKDHEYQASESAEAEKALDAYCAHADCPGKANVTALCIFRDASGGPLAEVNSTIRSGDTEAEEAVCKTVRTSGAIASFVPLDVYCKNDKRCMACGGP